MRHLNSGRKLGRNASHRKALFNSLLRALVRYEYISTTDAKAKELRGYADRLITLAKKDDLHARRLAFAQLQDRDLVAKLFNDIAKREDLATRTSGYTRTVKIASRRGDNAPVSLISWIGSTYENTESLRYPEHILARFEPVVSTSVEETTAQENPAELASPAEEAKADEDSK